MMDEQVIGIIGRIFETMPFLAYALWGWHSERQERKEIQRELTDVLKQVAGVEK
jgi:hypothetical protein